MDRGLLMVNTSPFGYGNQKPRDYLSLMAIWARLPGLPLDYYNQ